MAWFYTDYISYGGEPVKCSRCHLPMVADEPPKSLAAVEAWTGICPDCAINMGKSVEIELPIDDLIRERGVARRLMDGVILQDQWEAG